jgi:hypothetical protein
VSGTYLGPEKKKNWSRVPNGCLTPRAQLLAPLYHDLPLPNYNMNKCKNCMRRTYCLVKWSGRTGICLASRHLYLSALCSVELNATDTTFKGVDHGAGACTLINTMVCSISAFNSQRELSVYEADMRTKCWRAYFGITDMKYKQNCENCVTKSLTNPHYSPKDSTI